MEGIDCSTKLTVSTTQALKCAGIEVVGRYLGRTLRNGLTPDEVRIIQSAGLSLFLIWELSPTKKEYFSYTKGISDAAGAIAEAIYLGAPDGIAIYFTVDYDAQCGDLGAIVDYFEGVKDGLGGKYLTGSYGPHRVMQALKVDRYFQTYAWSQGCVYEGNHIYQYSNDVMLAGVAVDRDTVNSDAGLWGGNELKLANLVLYFGDADLQVAANLAQAFKCPVVHVANATPELLASATNKYQVGGATAPAGVTLLAGDNRFETMKRVLQAVGEI